ncbi:MAG: hypothetical protein H6672_06855 [Anaerolineaceae bacterium]|nr:hypothetical protein [Anaerolineaceae bacterium]
MTTETEKPRLREKKRRITQRRRSGILILWIGFWICVNIFFLVGPWLIIPQFQQGEAPIISIVDVIFLLLFVINLIGLELVWFWKKIGLYLLIGSVVIFIILDILHVTPILFTMFFLVGVVILYLIMRIRWQWYE